MFDQSMNQGLANNIASLSPSDAATLPAATAFDPDLVDRLKAQHHEIKLRLATIATRFQHNPGEAWAIAYDCATALHELRRCEALWLYPAIAQALADDPIAKRRFVSLRLLMNSLARRLLRSVEELVRAVRHDADIGAAMASVSKGLADYQRHNETEVYPMYDRMDRRQALIAAID